MRVRFTVYLAESMTTEVSISATEQVSEQVRLLLSCLQQVPLGGREAMKCAGLNHRPTFLYDYLQPAIQAGFVEMTQPDSPKSPTHKYRMTAKGPGYKYPGFLTNFILLRSNSPISFNSSVLLENLRHKN